MLFFWRKKRFKKRYPEPSDYRKNFIMCIVKLVIAFAVHALLFAILEHAPETVIQQTAAETFKGVAYVWYQLKFQLYQAWHIIVSPDTNWSDAVWVTWATFTTVGYGDISASTGAGRFVTMFIGAYGIAQFGIFIGSLQSFREAVSDLKKIFRWRWKDMKKHILVVGLPKQGTETFIANFLEQLQGYPELSQGHEILFMAENIPDNLDSISHRFPGLSVAGYRGSGSNEDDLGHCNLLQAHAVFVICKDPSTRESDDLTSSAVDRICKKMGFEGLVIAEASFDREMEFIRASGNRKTSVVRVSHYNPGLLIAEALAPGVSKLNRDAYQAGGMDTNDYPITINDADWVKVGCNALGAGWDFRGYANANGDVLHRLDAQNLHGDRVVDCTRVFISAPHNKQPSEAEVRKVLLAGVNA
ncbi:MAG: potassium channel family protein [Alphaproteobacteria bacterium]|nr:potassium channel family protein [Alphaproteobacteria bacterium]